MSDEKVPDAGEAPSSLVDEAVFRPVRVGNSLEDTVARLMQTIRLGVVAPGEALPSERELALRFSVSRDTVREAIRELVGCRISRPASRPLRRNVRERPAAASRRRSPLSPATPAEIDDVLGLRAILEVGAARAAASKALTARGARDTSGRASARFRRRRPPTTGGSTPGCTCRSPRSSGCRRS